MDKKLVVSRNMSRDLKSIPTKSRINCVVREKYPVYAANAKSHSSHNYFHRTPPRNFNSRKPYILPETVSLSNEEYIHANSQIWLNEECLKSNYDYNDIHSQWESIIQINFYSTEEILCPICLDTPSVCRTDKCGHTYCFPCLNKFLSYGSGFYTKCALCNQEIDPKRLKRASFIHRFPWKTGDNISMLLMKRNKSESFPIPINHNQSSIPFVYSNESRFSNVAVCSNTDLLSIIQMEILSLEDQLIEAIREESDRTASISEALECIKHEYHIASVLSDFVKPAKANPFALQIEHLKEIMRNDNVYYQAEDGSNVFMCPLNWKCMSHEFIDNDQCLPLRITGQVLEIEKFTITPDFVNRYRYLKYLPIGSSVSFVEIDLSGIVSESTLSKFDKELQRKNDNRVYQKRVDEALTTEKIKQENSFNASTGFICLDSLMKETDNLLDSDFVPLCAASTSPVASANADSSARSPDDKPLSFADMIHARNLQSVANSIIGGQKKPVEELPSRGFSLQDCVVKRTKKKNKK